MNLFRTVLADPPWNEQGGGKSKRGADKHYPLLKTPDILRVMLSCPHWENVHENSHLYLWVTNNFLKDGLWIMDALGYRYVTNVCWKKDKAGLGQYFRGQHELLLFGTRGKRPTEPRTDLKNIPSIFDAKRTKHSKKPEESYHLIESRSMGGYLELFAREPREGWTVWGNEV